MKDDLPTPVGAAIGIVRGIASGVARSAGAPRAVPLCTTPRATSPTCSAARRRWAARGSPAASTASCGASSAGATRRRCARGARGLDVPPTMRDLRARAEPVARGAARRRRQRRASDLVGRDAEKADLHAAYHAGGERQRRQRDVVTAARVVGEMGIGKTALVATFLGRAPAERAARARRVLAGEAWRSRSARSPSSCATPSARRAKSRSKRSPQLIARAGGGAAQGDASNPMVARLAELATNRQVGPRRRRGRALPQEASW